MIHNPIMLPKVRSEALMKAMADMPCTLRIASFAGVPCAAQETVIGAHLPVFGKGTSTKVTDLAVVACCASCHAILDGKLGVDLRDRYPHAYMERLLFALVETQSRLVMAGVLFTSDMEVV